MLKILYLKQMLLRDYCQISENYNYKIYKCVSTRKTDEETNYLKTCKKLNICKTLIFQGKHPRDERTNTTERLTYNKNYLYLTPRGVVIEHASNQTS